jgi:DNA mismatch endonuclease (patch repair protein)
MTILNDHNTGEVQCVVLERKSSREWPRLLRPTPARVRIMSAIRGRRNATTELALASLFRRSGVTGWRRNAKVIGKPDFVFPHRKVAVFVDGCFWHGCPRCYKAPRRNRAFWRTKIERNQKRDKKVSRVLRRAGWTVIRIWEHELSGIEGAPLKLVKVVKR